MQIYYKHFNINLCHWSVRIDEIVHIIVGWFFYNCVHGELHGNVTDGTEQRMLSEAHVMPGLYKFGEVSLAVARRLSQFQLTIVITALSTKITTSELEVKEKD